MLPLTTLGALRPPFITLTDHSQMSLIPRHRCSYDTHHHTCNSSSSCDRGCTHFRSPFNSRSRDNYSYTSSCSCSSSHKSHTCHSHSHSHSHDRDRNYRYSSRDEELRLRIQSGRDEYDIFISERTTRGDIYDKIERKEGYRPDEVFILVRYGRERRDVQEVSLREVDMGNLYDYAREGFVECLVVVGRRCPY